MEETVSFRGVGSPGQVRGFDPRVRTKNSRVSAARPVTLPTYRGLCPDPIRETSKSPEPTRPDPNRPARFGSLLARPEPTRIILKTS